MFYSSLFCDLPCCLKRLIFEFDSTFHLLFRKVIQQLNDDYPSVQLCKVRITKERIVHCVFSRDENFLLHGPWKEYSYCKENNEFNLLYSCYYNKGKKDGPQRRYFDNGNLYEEMMYHLNDNKKQSVITGYKRQYYLNGQLQNYVYRDKEGRRQGKSMSYYESGMPWTECCYLNDIYDGTYRSFHPSGKIEAEMGFEKGKAEGVYKRYDEEGNLTLEYWNRKGKRHGTYRYWINGWIKTLATYKNGRCVYEEFR